MNDHRTLIDPDALKALLLSPRPCVLLDCGFDLADPGAGERAHRLGHLPGAHYAHLDRDLSGPKTGSNGRHPLPSRAGFGSTLARWGIQPQTQVVTYDAQGGPYASRAWWMLRWMGHQAVAMLDGGPTAWLSAGGSLEVGPVGLVDADVYPASPQPAMPTIDAQELQAQLGHLCVLDARSAERFRGEVEPLDAVAGRIPGSTLRFFKDNLNADGSFKSAAALRSEFDALATSAAQIVHQCGSGVTACHNLLAMAHAGIEGSRLYPGSWSEWCADPSRPVAVG